MRAISYQLLIRVSRPAEVVAGALGPLRFEPGLYVYTGSARRNIGARLRRHLRQDGNKRRRWHIDFLLSSPAARVVAWRLSAIPECRLNSETSGAVPARRFGASDCRHGCGAHLKRLLDRAVLRLGPVWHPVGKERSRAAGSAPVKGLARGSEGDRER